MGFYKNILCSVLLLFLTSVGIGAQTVEELPKLKELKGKKLLQELVPLKHKNGMWGYANNEGKFVIKPVFSAACPYEGKIARVSFGGKWGTIGKNGLFVITPTYESLELYSKDSLAIFRLKGLYGLVNAKGRVIQSRYTSIDYADYGYRAKQDGKYATLNSQGVLVLSPRFDEMSQLDPERGLEHIYMDGKWGVLKDGKDILTLNFDERVSFLQKGLDGQPDFYLACRNGKLGVVTSYGQFITPCVYDEVSLAATGKYYVTKKGDKYGALSLKMTELITPILEDVPELTEDIFRVHNNGQFYAVNSKGAVTFQDCADLYYVFKPDEYETTVSIPEWAKSVKIENNLLERQNAIDNAYRVVDVMARHSYDPSGAMSDPDMPKGIDLSIPASSADFYGVSEGGAFIRASGIVSDYNSGHFNLHFRSQSPSGINVHMVSVQSTGEYLLTMDRHNFHLQKVIDKFNIKSFTGVYPVDFAILPDKRFIVRLAFVRNSSAASEELIETRSNYLPVERFEINLHKGKITPELETHALITFNLDSKQPVSLIQLPEKSDVRFTASRFSGFYVHSSSDIIADDKHPIRYYDNNGVQVWEYKPRYGEKILAIEETESYVYLCGSTLSLSEMGVEVPTVFQFDKTGVKVNSFTATKSNSRFSGLICKDHILYAKTSPVKGNASGSDYHPYFVLDAFRDNFGVRLKCVWERWGDGVIGGCGLVSEDGKWLNSPMLYSDQMCAAFDWEFSGFVADHLIVRHFGNYGVADNKGDIVVEPRYTNLEFLSNTNYLKAGIGNSYGVIDVSGKVIVPIEYDYVGKMQEDVIVVRKGNKYGCFNKTGEMIVPLDYEEIREYVGGMARIRYRGKFGFIDTKGEILVAPFSDEVENFAEDFTLVTIKNKVGFVNLQGDWLVPPMYDDGGSFSGGYAYLSMAGKYGYIDKTGETVIQMNYTGAGNFDPVLKLAPVKSNRGWGVIDMKGKVIVPTVHTKVELCSDGYIYVEKDGKCGIYSQTGAEVFPIKCEAIEYIPGKNLFNGDVAMARIDGQRVNIDPQGNLVYQYSLLTDK